MAPALAGATFRTARWTLEAEVWLFRGGSLALATTRLLRAIFLSDFIRPNKRENVPNLMSKAYFEATRTRNAKLAAHQLNRLN